MRGVISQVYASKSNTYWTTDLNKNPYTRSTTPSMISILDILYHTVRTFTIFRTTVGQLSSAANITLPKYLKDITISRGSP